jgi:hypothetical protein
VLGALQCCLLVALHFVRCSFLHELHVYVRFTADLIRRRLDNTSGLLKEVVKMNPPSWPRMPKILLDRAFLEPALATGSAQKPTRPCTFLQIRSARSETQAAKRPVTACLKEIGRGDSESAQIRLQTSYRQVFFIISSRIFQKRSTSFSVRGSKQPRRDAPLRTGGERRRTGRGLRGPSWRR